MAGGLFEQPGEADKEKARAFVAKWEAKLEKVSPKGGESKLSQTFWIELADLVLGDHEGLEFEKKTASGGRADVFSKDYGFIAEQKSKGIPLDQLEIRQGEDVTPFQQALRYRGALTAPDIASVRTIVTSNFDQFWFYDLMTEEGLKGAPCVKVSLEELPESLDYFKNLFGGEEVKKQFGILNPEYTALAAEKVKELYKMLVEGLKGKTRLSESAKEKFEEKIPLIVMRIVFLLFADNTSTDIGKIFQHNQFKTFINKSTDPKHFTRDLMELFKCLNIENDEERADELIPEELICFPYVDGGLFEEKIAFPDFSEEAVKKVRDLANDFKQWDEIDISVFGPIMDCVFSEEDRRQGGIYYTSRENIQKVINPLFMDDLRAEFEGIKEIGGHEEKQAKLKAFHDKLSRLQFFDPACGSGNFLTETYMELRFLEDEVIGLENTVHDLDKEIKVSLSQFHGIELSHYAAMVARTALQIAREQALERSYEWFKDAVSTPPHFLPLKNEARGIICGNSLTIEWGDLVTPSQDLYVFGNPPFAGDYNKSAEQQKELDDVFAPYPAGKLDYCAAWYYKAAKFLNGSGARFAFVSTNSVTQGVQVEGLFKPVFDLGWKISFAWPSVLWDRSKDAAVYVVIIGFTQDKSESPRLYEVVEDEEFDWESGAGFEAVEVENITPNNLEALSTVFVGIKRKPLATDLPLTHKGSEADSKDLILQEEYEYEEAEKDRIAAKYVREYLGAYELINGKKRWCLWLVDSTPEDRRKSKFLHKRIEATKESRKSKSDPWLFGTIHQPDTTYLAIPAQFSGKRQYFTASFLDESVIASNTLYVAPDPSCFAFSVIETSMFMTWQRLVGGRLKEDNRFSNRHVWNTFPLPKLSKDQKDLIIEGGNKVLEARNAPANRGSSLADLYDPDNMPQDLKKAHEALDKAMDSVFSDKPFRSEEERQKALLEAYKKMTGEKEGE